MWPLLRADLIYDRLRLVIVSFFCLTCLITIWFGAKWERNVAPMTMLILLISALVAVFAGEQGRVGQKRDRLHVSLPVSLWQIGFSHLIYPIVVWIAIYILFEVSRLFLQLLIQNTLIRPSFLQILTLSGLFLIINATVLLCRDLSKTFTEKPQQVIIYMSWFLLFISVLLPFTIVTNFLGAFGENMPLQSSVHSLSESPIWFLLLGAGLSIISLFFFMKRRSYVGS